MYSSPQQATLAEPRLAYCYWIIAAGQEVVGELKKKKMSASRGCSTSAGNELIKREKEENSLRECGGVGGTGRVGAANGIVIFFFFFLCKPACSRVCVEEYCRDQFTVVRVRCLSSLF